jgi:hypothetical protein
MTTTTSSHSPKDPEDSHKHAATAVRQAFLDQLLLKQQEKSKEEEEEGQEEDVINRQEENCDDRVLPQGNGDIGEDDDLYISNSLISPNNESAISPDGRNDCSQTASSNLPAATETAPPSNPSPHSYYGSNTTSSTVTSKAKTPITPTRPSQTSRLSTATTTHDTAATAAIVFHNTSPYHPGLAESGFHHWYDVETSLYRIYRVGRTDGVDVIPPYLPQSRRGNVQVYLHVTNAMYCTVEAFWVDYHGREVSKGKFRHGTTWSQTTWMEHPWVFRKAGTTLSSPDQPPPQPQQLLLHYIPYRIIPTTDAVPTTSPDDPSVGMHQFTLTTNRRQDDSYWACQVEDPVLPHPASRHFAQHTDTAIAWVLQHMLRTNYDDYSFTLLLKYLMNILHHPDEGKYRHWRIAASTKFYQHVWNTAARGLLFCLGAVEHGAYCELGNAQALRHERVQDLSQLVLQLQQWQEHRKRHEHQGTIAQPEGAEDGYGRAGFGRAGQMNHPY